MVWIKAVAAAGTGLLASCGSSIAPLRPAWQLTGRTRLEATVAYSNRRYLGDPGTALSGGLVREDHLRQFGLELRYQIARRTWLSASVRQLSRDSNYPGYDFTDRWAGVGVSTAF
jgi:hypothetical protein